MTLYARLAVLITILLALAAGAWKSYTMGAKSVLAEWTAQKLVDSETARIREQAMQKSTEKIGRDYEISKTRNDAAAVATASQLHDLQAIISTGADTSPAGGDHGDPRLDIIAECAGTVTALDAAVKELASQTIGLQDYAESVCLSN